MLYKNLKDGRCCMAIFGKLNQPQFQKSKSFSNGCPVALRNMEPIAYQEILSVSKVYQHVVLN